MRKVTTGSGPTVLMVEDHDNTACLVRFMLEQQGYTVRHAPDGSNAKRLTETSPAPDLVLLDISLPNLSGLEILRTIRSTPGWREIPVLMLTANALPDSMTAANNLGATEYLKKPFSPERLLQTIKSFLPLPQSPSAIEEQS